MIAARTAAMLALTMVGAALLPRAGHAQPAIIQEHRGDSYASPQRFALELRFGPYYPNVDKEFEGASGEGPHRRYFGQKRRLMSQLEVDYQILHLFGSLGLGASVGYFKENAKAFVNTAAGVTDQRSGDNTSLTLVPTALLLVYRFDVPALRLGVPLVPYGKVGLNYTFWWVRNGDGDVAKAGVGVGRGRGGTRGWQVAAGLSLLLDVLDPDAARELDGEIGVNHTYLFIEYGRFAASGLGRENVLHVDDSTWLAGLMFEF